MGDSWDEYATGWDDNADVILYSNKAFDSLCGLSQFESLDGLSVLDFGCGTGSLTEKLAARANRVVGLDTSSAMLEILNKKSLANIDTIGAPLSGELVASHPLLQTPFDLIVASSVCGFLPDYEGTLCLLNSLLAPGGWFVQWDWLATDPAAGHGLQGERVQTALEQAGFGAVSVSVPFSLTSEMGTMDVLMGVGGKGMKDAQKAEGKQSNPGLARLAKQSER